MDFGLWSEIEFSLIVAIFFTFSGSLVLLHYETMQVVPPPPDVVKAGFSVLMFHEAIYKGHIVRFTSLEEVFPSLVCGRAKFELSTHSVSLFPPAHLRVVHVSTFYQGCLPHIAIWCSTYRLHNSTGAPPSFHTGWYTAFTIISPTVIDVVCSMCSLIWSMTSLSSVLLFSE